MDPKTPKCHLRKSEVPTSRRIDEKNILWIPVNSVNPHLICGLCQGYLYEACTITECMHSFCKNCIVKHLLRSLNCPMCAILIHPTDPFVHIRFDGLLQDIVYALLPHVEKEELEKERAFYDKHEEATGGRRAQHLPSGPSQPAQPSPHVPQPSHRQHLVPQVAICLQCIEPEEATHDLDKKFVTVSGRATIQNVSSFLKRKLHLEESLQIDLYCPCRSGVVCLSRNHTLKNVKDLYSSNMDILHLKYDIREQ